jgi:RNA polymerase sigma factor (sigma-70 family)
MATASLNQVLGHLRLSAGQASDADLLRAFLATRDPAAFSTLVRRHSSTVLAACRQVLRQESDVEDAFQATFLVLFKSAHSVRRGTALRTWLFGVAHRVAVNARCRRAKLEARERTNSEPPHPVGELPDLSWREASAILHEELNRLPDKLRLPLLLCYLEGKSRDEAAAELGTSANVVKGALERGRVRLRSRLQRRGIALSAGLLAAVDAATGSAVPPAWVDSAVLFAGPGRVPPAVSALANGVLPVVRVTRLTSALAAGLLIAAGTLIAASGSPDAPPPPRKEAPAEPPAKDAPKPPASEKLIVTGKVTDAEGKPVAGAQLYVPVFLKFPPVSEADVGTKVVGETAADGSFKIEIEKTEITRYLIVGAPGHSIGWANLEKATGTHEAAIKLAADVPVAGRVIDTEGKPLAGAKVQVVGVYQPADGKLDSFLTGWKNQWDDALRRIEDRMYMPLASVHGDGKTDRDGRFTLKGIGAERVAQVEIEAAGYGKLSIYLVTRPGLDAGPINMAAHDQIPPELRIPGQPPLLSGPKVEAIVEGAKVIEGVVTDAESGKPLAGIMVTSGSGYNSQVTARSDKDGKYRLTGLTKAREHLVHTMTRDESTTPYLMWSARVLDTPGLGSIKYDIQMTRGVVVTGRLLDRSTGKPVEGSVRLAPLSDNKYFGTRPAFNGYSSDRLSHGIEKGKFRVVTIPGTSVVMAQAYESKAMIGGKAVNPYRPAGPDPDHPKYFTQTEDGYRVDAAGNSFEPLDLFNVCKVLDLKPGAGPVEIDLYVERGQTATLKVVDPDGKPLSGATIGGLTASWPMVFTPSTDSTTVYALDDKPRTLMILHSEKKLGGTVEVKGGQTVMARLAPLGTVAGKLVDTDGHPIAGVAVGVQFPTGPGDELYREAKLAKAPAVTAADGSFHLGGVVPGVKFYLSLTKGREYYVGEPKIGLRQAEAGKTLDLGTLPVKGQRLGQ